MPVLPLRQIRNRLLIFLGFFILLSGTTGSWIVSSGLLSSAGFWIYGNIGKLVILLLIFLGLQLYKKMAELQIFPRTRLDNGLVGISLICVPIFLYVSSLLVGESQLNFFFILLSHALIWTSGLTLFLGIFGWQTVHSFIKHFWPEVRICLILLPFLYVGIFEIWQFWPFFSTGVLRAVTFLLSFSFPTHVVPPYTLYVKNFGIEIAEACSGLDSLFMFSMLYLLIVLSDWQSILKKRAFFAYFPLAIGLYLINILRVYLLVLIGALWSPYVAVHLFHTYAGMVFFIAYFLVFFKWGYRWLKRK